MFGLDALDTLFVVWAFFLQTVLIIHFVLLFVIGTVLNSTSH